MFRTEKGMPKVVATGTREHSEAFITNVLDRWNPATANNRFRGLQSFFKWLADEGEIRESPMARMKPPRVPENPPPVLQESELRALLATCEKGTRLEDRRDHAILRLFIDTGARRAEIGGLRFDPKDDANNDVDLDQGIIRVLGKGPCQGIVIYIAPGQMNFAFEIKWGFDFNTRVTIGIQSDTVLHRVLRILIDSGQVFFQHL